MLRGSKLGRVWVWSTITCVRYWANSSNAIHRVLRILRHRLTVMGLRRWRILWLIVLVRHTRIDRLLCLWVRHVVLVRHLTHRNAIMLSSGSGLLIAGISSVVSSPV